MVDVAISLSARDDLEELPVDVQERIKQKLLNDVSEEPERHLRTLSNSEHHSIRVGDYRVIVDYESGEELLKVLTVGHRSTIYDRELD
jgi:mRNA-degrading endonuclease RelE of RelBE toxin-antitoxin system